MPSSDAPPEEKELWAGGPALRHWWPSLAAALLLTVAALPLYVSGAGAWALAGPGLGAALWTATWIRAKSRAYTLSSQRLRSVAGLASRISSQVELGDIRNLKLKQTLGQRLLGLGDIEIESSGGAEVEIRLEAVASPNDVLDRIRAARLALQPAPRTTKPDPA